MFCVIYRNPDGSWMTNDQKQKRTDNFFEIELFTQGAVVPIAIANLLGPNIWKWPYEVYDDKPDGEELEYGIIVNGFDLYMPLPHTNQNLSSYIKLSYATHLVSPLISHMAHQSNTKKNDSISTGK